MKYLCVLAFLIQPFNLFAQNSELSKECVESVRDIYRFYFHQISPNPKSDACKNSVPEKLDPKTMLEMQIIISELKQHCPKNLIAQINNSFPEGTAKG